MAQEESLAPVPPPDRRPEQVQVRYGRVTSVDIFMVKDSELDLLERGSPADLQLNFGIFSLSTAASAIFALSTATFANPVVQQIFTMIAVVGILFGVYLLLAGRQNRKSVKGICKSIRLRIEQETTQELPINPSSPKGGS
jgi:hypothetical protein